MKISICTDDGELLDVLKEEDIFGPEDEDFPRNKNRSPDIDTIYDAIKRARRIEIAKGKN